MHANEGSFSESKTKEPKICRRCPKTVKDTPALKRHCSEVHGEDIDGNPVPVQLFPCYVTTCRKHTVPFKRREKLANHIHTFHAEVIEGQEVNSGVISGEGHDALIINDTVEAGDDFGGNHGAARVGAGAHHESAEVGYPPMLEELLFLPIEAQSAPVPKIREMVLGYTRGIPVDSDVQAISTTRKGNWDIASSSLDSAWTGISWDSPSYSDMNPAIRETTEMPNKGFLDAVISPALMQSFPSGGTFPDSSDSLALPELHLGFPRHIANEGWPTAADKTVIVEYDTFDEYKQALQDGRQKALQKVQFFDQQIERLEGMQRGIN